MRSHLRSKIILALTFLFCACATSPPQWEAVPHSQIAQNETFAATITPIFLFDGYKGFLLNVHNKTGGKIEVDWNNTHYIHQGQKKGLFDFKGREMDADKKKIVGTIIPPNSMFSSEIVPEYLSYTSKIAATTVFKPMEAGQNGIELAVIADGKVLSETITVDIVVSDK